MGSVLVFEVNGSAMALGVEMVEEVRTCGRLTIVPGAPADVLGLVRHRGRMVPLIDLRRRFTRVPDRDAGEGSAGSADENSRPPGCVIVVQSMQQGTRRWCALAVDRVLGVRSASSEEAPPHLDLDPLFGARGERWGAGGTVSMGISPVVEEN